jgi:hypothetical protein
LKGSVLENLIVEIAVRAQQMFSMAKRWEEGKEAINSNLIEVALMGIV